MSARAVGTLDQPLVEPELRVSAPDSHISHMDIDTHTEIIPENEVYEGGSSSDANDENEENFIIDDDNKARASRNVKLNLWINTFMVLGLTITFGPMFDKYLYDITNHKNRIVGIAESVSGLTSLVVFLPV